MTTANATHPGRITIPGTDLGVRGTLVAEPQTENMLLALDDRLALGPVKVDTDSAGVLEAPGLVVPIVSGVLWLLRFEPHRHDIPDFVLGVYNLNTSGVPLDDLVPTVPVAIDETVNDNILGLVADLASFTSANDAVVAPLLDSTTAASSGKLAVRRLDAWVTTPSADNSTQINAAFTAARAGGFMLRATAGTTYRGHNINPTGVTCDWQGATLKVPDAVQAKDIFVPTDGFTTIGGTFDGNKASATTPITGQGNGVDIENAAGWSTPVTMIRPVFRNCYLRGVSAIGSRVITDAASAPYGRVILDNPAAYNCDVGFYFTGLEGISVKRPVAYDCVTGGVRTDRCLKSVITQTDIRRAGGHGYTSVHCVEDEVDGESSDNGFGGFVWGGADPSGTYLQGRRHRIGKITANRNGTAAAWAGVTFDPTIAGLSGTAQQVDAKVDQILANNNSASGVQFTNSKDVHITSATCDNNGLHGLSITAQTVTVLRATTRGNATHGIAEFGATTQYGGHSFGFVESTGNGTTNTVPFQGAGTRLPSRFMGSPLAAQTVTTQATFTFDCITYTRAKITAQATALTIANPSGTPAPMQSFVLRIKDSGSSRSIAYGSQFRAIGVTLPTATVASKTLYLGFIWNSDDTTWDCIAVGQQA